MATDLTTLNDHAAASRTGELIDLSANCHDEKGLKLAVEWCDTLQSRSLAPALRTSLHYCEANAWSALGCVRSRAASTPVQWSGDAADCWEKEIVNLRRARNSPGFRDIHPVQRCQILTNLGNRLSHLGRISEALEQFDRALEIDPRFGMALGNRGITLVHYMQALPHLPHAPGLCATTAFHHAARESLAKAGSLAVEDGAEEVFRQYAALVTRSAAIAHDTLIDMSSVSLGRTQEEQDYRRWSLTHRLFLNPMNDLGAVSAAAADTLHLPPVTVDLDSGPFFEGFFNQIKQEFVSARYLLYEGSTATQPHFSDTGVTLYDTMDYPVYGLAGEKVKLALRSIYSLFDKMAFFLNYYLKLGIPARQVSFRGFWYQSQSPKQGLKPRIEASDNWPLRGLFWMAKDLYDIRPEFREAMEPEAREIDITRNHCEHKYLKVYDDLWPEMAAMADSLGELPDDAFYSIGCGMLAQRTLRLMKLARSALISLAYAVHLEESRKQAGRGPDDNVLSLPIGWMDDSAKLGMKAQLDQPKTESTA